MIATGASDEKLLEYDRMCQLRSEILKREPWRDKRWKERHGTWPNGKPLYVIRGKIDWSGTEMQEFVDRSIAKERSKPKTIGHKVDGHWVYEVKEWDGEKWVATRHADICECPDCIA